MPLGNLRAPGNQILGLWARGLVLSIRDLYPKAQNSPKALYSMVFRPKSLKICVLRA